MFTDGDFFDPKIEIVEDVLEMYRCNPRCDEVCPAEGGMIKVYKTSRGYTVTWYVSKDNPKGHNSFSYYYDNDGRYISWEAHKTNT